MHITIIITLGRRRVIIFALRNPAQCRWRAGTQAAKWLANLRTLL